MGKVKKPVKKPAKKPAKKAGKSKTAKKTPSKKIAAKSMPVMKRATKSLSQEILRTMKISPYRDRILVKRAEESDRTPGGLYIPSTAGEQPLRGEVMAVGQGNFNKKGVRRAFDVQLGEEVLFAKYSGTEVSVDGCEYLLLKESEILGVVE